MDYNKAVGEHYRRIREDPIYRLQEQLEDLRAEMMPALWNDPIAEETEPMVFPRAIYFKGDIRAFELNKRVTELENANKYLKGKLKELTANASKRKTNRYKYK